MKFQPLTPDLDPLSETFNNSVSESGLVTVGVHKVLYGYRVQAFYTTQKGRFIELNWCGGNVWADVERLYSLMLACLATLPEEPGCLNKLPPASNRKPFYIDAQFTTFVCRMAGEDMEVVKLPPPPLPNIRELMLLALIEGNITPDHDSPASEGEVGR